MRHSQQYTENALIEEFENWLEKDVKGYINNVAEPNLWELMKSQTPLVTATPLSKQDTTTFSDDEQIRIKMSINEFRILLVKKFKPSSDELKAIDERLKYLSEAVERLNKIDWRGVAIMTLITISTTLALDTEKGRLLFELFKQVFSGMLHLLH